ncbi:40S ribosomal protein S27a [Theileria orientalis strain Shintoku]|uniref:40S ribosomal protein S27a n=1 Tax=Theileria orientalis strain Shintoku TaxID=869250 RepID=J4C495_THEOR|nr:40S ribosomal protein S27a [Theileria orientalis strain Shintoku]PVC53631.1 40S ribosomal protein S27a [Theileria orientalis]BAM41796.1 40S ribosomal protein S27a [Theileria orientalis strain Shintoku]|eukprot:XP_009692097.1 40S ribosomal protein S27a [Theileria orientalis strain Shintoku]
MMEDMNSSIRQVLIKLFDGRTAVFNTYDHKTVGDLKHKITSDFDLDSSFSHSIWLGLQELGDDICLSDLLQGLDSINLTHHLCLPGGGKKRKKKQYTTPKKIKHKKKKVKLAVLKFYKVEGDKVVRVLKECPAETCGTGVFMAAHHNRSYCGRCGLTYILSNAS